MHHLVSADGTVVMPGTMVHAVTGPHAGTHWRLEKVHHNGETHVLRCSRLLRSMRVRMDFHPSVFGLHMIEIKAWYKIGKADLRRFWGKIDEGVIMGALALVPLAVFEAFHGAEHFREFIEPYLR